MDLLSDPVASKKGQQKEQEQKKGYLSQSPSNMVKQQWRSQQDYKRDIIALEIQNQKYRNQLYELGETVNKILDKVKAPNKSSVHTPNLQQQLQLVKKQLHNVNQFIEIYQKQLSTLNNKKKKDQVQTLVTTEQILKTKTQELIGLKKQVKQLSHRNKALQYKLLEYSKKGKVKSVDQQALQLKELISQNKNLKNKLQELQTLHQRKQKWLENNIESAKQLQKKVHDQEMKLPRIDSNKSFDRKERSVTSLPKLQSEKKIYTKWLETATNTKKNNNIIQKELLQLQKINKVVHQKISNTSAQIKEIQLHIERLKRKIEEQQEIDHQTQHKQPSSKMSFSEKQKQRQKSISNSISEDYSSVKNKKKHVGTMVIKKVRNLRKDWVGKFDGLRFSDNRFIKEESRLYKVLFNTNGYCQFFYYSWKDNKKRSNSKLPFDTNSLVNPGKESTFTVEYPDFIKNIRLKINIKTHRITQLSLVSNLGIEAQFIVDTSLHTLVPGSKNTQKLTTNKQQQPEVNYEMDIKSNQAIACIFGSYGTRLDEKKQIINVWLEGLGAQIIEDFVQELI